MFFCANFDSHHHEMESQAPPSKFARLSNSSMHPTLVFLQAFQSNKSNQPYRSQFFSSFYLLSFTGTRLASGGNVERNRRHGESASPPIGLRLELGRGSGSSQRPIISCKKHYALTVLQLQELQLQSLIYKYIQAGFPVPFQLVLPIWRSVATSLGGLSSRLLQLYPAAHCIWNTRME
ncbi:hypothetical protein OIU77_027183 [Salix suchowensis]|uniref:Growth-regulating factor n=1 Tax=Salix suchowensis TaxID=1278906 RepID=A0ABQ9BR81_9ROSI|nr:hypothetical protein OIU77_027183 [Salix suchowensis]